MTYEQLTAEALSLKDAERADLVALLLESLDAPSTDEIEQQWRSVAAARAKEIDSGEVNLVSAEEVRNKALEILK